MRLVIGMLFALSCCVQADEVVTFVRHNGLVTELYTVETADPKTGFLYEPTRFISFTGSRLIYDRDTDSAPIRTTYWRRDGDTILIYDGADEPAFAVPVDKIEYQFYDKTFVPESFEGERLS